MGKPFSAGTKSLGSASWLASNLDTRLPVHDSPQIHKIGLVAEPTSQGYWKN